MDVRVGPKRKLSPEELMLLNRGVKKTLESPLDCKDIKSIRSINQGKLEVLKQKRTRVNINIIGISELKWTGMGKFNSDDYYIYYCGQESFRRNGVALIVKRVQNGNTWVQSQKQQNELCSFPRQIIQCHSNATLYPNC